MSDLTNARPKVQSLDRPSHLPETDREANLFCPAKLMREFDWQLVYPGSPWKERAYTGWVHWDMWVRITEAEPL